MIRWRRLLAAITVTAVFVAVPGEGRAATDGLVADPTGLAFAVRGAREQLVPLPPPPMLCAPGSYVHWVETGGVRLVAFTFDDGPWPYNTEAIMSALEQRGGRATFFMIGGLALKYPTLARAVVARGHQVGNHTLNHYREGYRIAAEIVPFNVQVGAVLGVTPRVFRSPGMVKSTLVQNELARVGMCNFFGNILPGDTILPARNSTQLCNSFKAQLRPGSIVMLHDGGNHLATVYAVPCMADYALRNGYRMVTLTELLAQGYWTV